MTLHEQVLRLQVAVDHVTAVQVVHAVHDLVKEAARVRFLDTGVCDDVVEQLAAITVRRGIPQSTDVSERVHSCSSRAYAHHASEHLATTLAHDVT